MLHERELTQHLQRAGVCRFIPACKGHGEESLITETMMFSPPRWCPSSVESHKVPGFLHLLGRSRTLHRGDGEAGLQSLHDADTQVPKHQSSHALHFPGAEAVLFRGPGSLYAQLSLCVHMPQEAYMAVCSVSGERHCNCKLLGRHLNHTQSSPDMHALSGHVLIAVLTL